MSLSSSVHSFIARERQARVAPALRSAGGFDRAAIMREAVKLARTINRRFGSWSRRMGIALRTVWGRAKAAAMSAEISAHVGQPIPVRVPVRSPASQTPHVFLRGSRRFTHGW